MVYPEKNPTDGWLMMGAHTEHDMVVLWSCEPIGASVLSHSYLSPRYAPPLEALETVNL